MNTQHPISLEAYPMEWIIKLCGPNDTHLQLLRDTYQCGIILRDNALYLLDVDEQTVQHVEGVVKAVFTMLENDIDISQRDIIYLCKMAQRHALGDVTHLHNDVVGKTLHGKLIHPKTIGQRYLVKAMRTNDIVFASGVAGTGKTYLAVVYAASLLKKGDIRKLILTRPAVEAGENLGFLPGDLKEKVDPYMRPLYDALYDTLGKEQVEKLLEKEVIEIAPLAYMRGRTLDDAFIILDEAQNTTRAQMKMFLTRMGFHSKIVITGDVSQIDLIKKHDSGLSSAKQLLDGIEGIAFVELTSLDVVRHPLVQKIIERYEMEEEKNG